MSSSCFGCDFSGFPPFPEREPSLDKYWEAHLYTNEGGIEGVRIEGLTEAGKKEEMLVIPEKMGEYPVLELFSNKEYGFTAYKYISPEWGRLKKIVIEGSLKIRRNFFGEKEGLCNIEFKSKMRCIIEEDAFLNESGRNYTNTILVIPEDANKETYLPEYKERCFNKNEFINGFLTNDKELITYDGNEENIVIPEGITNHFNQNQLKTIFYSSKPIKSIKFPTTFISFGLRDYLYDVPSIWVSNLTELTLNDLKEIEKWEKENMKNNYKVIIY